MLITNVTGNFFLKENDTATEMHLAVQEVDGTPVDLSSAAKVEVVIGTLEGRYLTKTPTILDAPGEFTFGLDEGDMLPTGDNLLEVHIYSENNEKRVAPSKGHYKLKVQRTIGALGMTVTTYTLDYFISEVNRILFGLPQLLERGNALADRMDVLVDESEQALDEVYTATDASRTATTQSVEATAASELATQASIQATIESDAATAEAIQATTDADAATQASVAQTQAAQTATQDANAAAQFANEHGEEAKFQALQAENATADAQEATAAANTATDNANTASSRANTSAGRADTATANANNAANAANTAATEANTARDSANLAASLADGIATELRGYDNAIVPFSLETRYLKHQPVRSDGNTYKAKVETQGNPLPVAPARSNEWFDLVAEKGEKGDMGTGINILGKVDSVADLPASGEPGDSYLIGPNIHIWDGNGWTDGGAIQGPQGEQGEQGETGVGLQYTWNGSQLGVKRADESSYTYHELKGAKGDKGDNAKIITLDFVIPATDETQVDGNLINVHDYIYDAAADSIQFYLNSRILYPGEDFEMEGGTFRLLNWTGYDDPANVTFYIKVTRSVFNIDPEVSHATVVGALGYTPVDSATLTEHLLDRTLKHHVHHVAEVPTDLQNMGIMFKVDGSSSDVPGVTTNTDLMNRVVQAEQKFDTEISDVASQLAQTTTDLDKRGISPLKFGVVGGGVIDDTIALQNYIDYCLTNNLLMALNGKFATTGITFSKASKIVGDAEFIAINDNQPFVIKNIGRMEWTGKLKIDGVNKALYGFIGQSFIHSHFTDVETNQCKVWGFTFDPVGNNAMVQVDKFRGSLNGIKHNTTFTVSNVVAEGGNKVVSITIDSPINSSYYKKSYDIIYVIYNNRPYKVKGVNTDNTIGLYNLPLIAGNTGTIDILIGGALNIPSYGDNGVGSWGVLDIFANKGIGVNMSALYGHTFNRIVLQGNSVGLACQDITLGVVLNSPYFEVNNVDVVVWSYMKGTMTDPVIEFNKMFSLVNHNIYGYDYNKELNIIYTDKSPNVSNDFSLSNPGNRTIYPSKSYSHLFNINQTAKTFTIKNDIVYQNTLSNYINMTLHFEAGSTLTFNLANANGDTIHGVTSYSVNVFGTVHIIVTKVGTDWKITVLKQGLQRATIPTTGTYKKGDYVENTNLSELGTVGSKYLVYGWKRLTDGNTHVLNTDWFEDRRITGN